MIKIRNLTKYYSELKVYEDFSLDLKEGEITCVLGESGSGKTTLLNCIARLTDYQGTIDQVQTSYIFQSPRLVPSLTVFGNLKLIGASKDDIKTMLEKVGIADKINSYPHTLSGGQAQRAAIARAFLFKSSLILMDEPFASLDLKLKDIVGELFCSLQRGEGRTALFVTHDIDEALAFSDRIIVLSKGGVVLDEVLTGEVPRSDYSEELRKKIISVLKNS